MDQVVLADLKRYLREADMPFFSDADLAAYYEKNGKDFKATMYECCIVKAESTDVNFSGVSMPDYSAYFLRIARRYKANNSGCLRG